MILYLLTQLFRSLPSKRSGVDPDFVEAALFGHTWILEWKYPGLLLDREHSKAVAGEVTDILDMWLSLEGTYQQLSANEQIHVAAEAKLFGKSVSYPGFEPRDKEHGEIGEFAIQQLEPYQGFAVRQVQRGLPLDAHRRMLTAFVSMKPHLGVGLMTASQIIEILTAAVHPSQRKDSSDAPRARA
ncbi:MAG: hypothetical protein H0X25_20980 [Acidobacteriales bacterium]|nr:hypothetical protein [Terriglobales bacterium]